MSTEQYTDNPTWPLLVETVHSMIMYTRHKYYIQSVVLSEKPDITPQDIATNLSMPLGEAIVILHELKTEKQEKKE